MRERIQARISELQSELDTGQRRLQELEVEQGRLREVMLRITGAKQVLEELLAADAAESNGAVSSVTADVPAVEPVAAGGRAEKAAADAVMG